MSTEANKQLAREFFARFSANDIAGALDTMAEDMSWWIAGRADVVPTAGPHSKAQMARMFQAMSSELKNGLKFTVKGVIAEGEQVAIELESYGELRNGRVYNNQYHTLMTIRGGKIREVREYLDTQHVYATWFRRGE
jgi:ketosteroid isomerase-like protein